ncbi:glycosyltransferase family 2 protein [Lysobacter korlensis]|uniref:Glycosyltransferase family 2 protein n=1 Tax=Lysobacter korlensis TaxID=553636 RepID=A0ABV6RX88_9GAMM
MAVPNLPLLARRLRFDSVEFVKAHLRRVWKARELVPGDVRPSLADAGIVAVMAVRNEVGRLPSLLAYYRGLGVDHFILIDNGSADGLDDLISGEQDISWYRSAGEYRRARYANDWVNEVLHRHCDGKWVLYVDADEFLDFAAGTATTLPELCALLQSRGQRALHALLLDMYSERPGEENVVTPGGDPLGVCRLYDASGYVSDKDPATGTTWIKGGVRGELFDDVWDGPALNKTPLVRWRRGYAFLKSAHELWPRSLNQQSAQPQSVLLHLKFTSLSLAKIAQEDYREQHTSEYAAYDDLQDRVFLSDRTRTYRGADGLVEEGLIAPVV